MPRLPAHSRRSTIDIQRPGYWWMSTRRGVQHASLIHVFLLPLIHTYIHTCPVLLYVLLIAYTAIYAVNVCQRSVRISISGVSDNTLVYVWIYRDGRRRLRTHVSCTYRHTMVRNSNTRVPGMMSPLCPVSHLGSALILVCCTYTYVIVVYAICI